MSPERCRVLADVIVVIHLLWVIFMVGGVGATLAGLYWRRLLRHAIWRWVHLAGLVYSAGLGVLGRYCPLTTWEYDLRMCAGEVGPPESFIIRLVSRLVFPDVDPGVLTAVSAAGALVVVGIFVWQPPWRA